MKKKGLTLIEIIVSLAIFSVVIVSISHIFASTSINIRRGSDRMRAISIAREELNLAMFSFGYTGEKTRITQEDTTIKVLGVDVPIRYVKAEYDNKNSSEEVYSLSVFCLPESDNMVNIQDKAFGFFDINYNNIHDYNEKMVYVNGINNINKNEFGNFVILQNTYTFNQDLAIEVNGDIIISSGVIINNTNKIDLVANNIYISGANVSSENIINFTAREKAEINKGSTISSTNKSISINAGDIAINGLSNKRTRFLTKDDCFFNISGGGNITLGNSKTSTIDSYVIFSGGNYEEYAYCGKNTLFDSVTGISPVYNSQNNNYFK